MDVPLSKSGPCMGLWGGAPSDLGVGTLNRNVFEDMIKLYKLCNESFISLHEVHGHNDCCTRLHLSHSFFLEVSVYVLTLYLGPSFQLI